MTRSTTREGDEPIERYGWYDGDTDTFLYHTELNGEYVDPFFETEDEAKDYLAKLADNGNKEDYMGLSLRKVGDRKIGEAVEVLTEQSGLMDF